MKMGEGAIDFDQWRTEYDTLTFDQQREFYDWVAEKHPDQAEYNEWAVAHFLARAWDALGPMDVMEIGGWDGKLANDMLQHYNSNVVVRWTNYDISEKALYRHEWRQDRYFPVLLEKPAWKTSFPYTHDVLIATHFIEHIRAEELMSLVASLTSNVKFVAFQAPIPVSAMNKDWTGYTGSHILEIGWAEVSRIMAVFGFELCADLCNSDGHGDFIAWKKTS